ncbi:MAG TPA: VOC family protein [Candidatus Acidoferrales bacterium]|nr:VOC family protein [Candidatus Acidoferrales bacterium]
MSDDYANEDVGNIALLEHINVQVPDQAAATLFYVVGMGFTRDPYLTVGLSNMWVNLGEQQFHLPTRSAQVIPGHIGIVTPDLRALSARLEGVRQDLEGTKFAWAAESDHIAVTCPWGNRFRCYEPAPRFGDMLLGLPYIEFHTRPGTAAGIARFYEKVMGAPSVVLSEPPAARVAIGRNQWITFRETDGAIPPYDGHHIAVYVAKFSSIYRFLRERGLILEEVRNHQFRFKTIVDPDSGEEQFLLEHEVRSLKHPMYQRPFVNRDPAQSQRNYRRGRDALIPYSAGEAGR